MSEFIKYPRTMNFPWSQSNSSDDVWWNDCSPFEGQRVIVSEKLDGENTNIYPNSHVHARSIDSVHHPSRSWVKGLASQICYRIPDDHRICGENVFAWHSVFYRDLPTYFFAFGIYEGERCLSWDDTVEICDDLELHTAPLVYDGIWDEKLIRSLWTGKGAFPTFASEDGPEVEAEGYVVRLAESFMRDEFRQKCAKYVRKNHVQTDQNWMTREVIPNILVDNP